MRSHECAVPLLHTLTQAHMHISTFPSSPPHTHTHTYKHTHKYKLWEKPDSALSVCTYAHWDKFPTVPGSFLCIRHFMPAWPSNASVEFWTSWQESLFLQMQIRLLVCSPWAPAIDHTIIYCGLLPGPPLGEWKHIRTHAHSTDTYKHTMHIMFPY